MQCDLNFLSKFQVFGCTNKSSKFIILFTFIQQFPISVIIVIIDEYLLDTKFMVYIVCLINLYLASKIYFYLLQFNILLHA